MQRTFVWTLALTLGAGAFTQAASAELLPDEDWPDRRDAVLTELAGRYEHEATYENCVRFGFATKYLLAKIEAGERGLVSYSVAEAVPEIEHLSQETVRLIGTGQDKGRCAWEEAGSPAALHAALGLGLILHRYRSQLPPSTRDLLAAALASNWREQIGPYLVNGNLSIVAGRLLAGEALGQDSELWQQGLADLDEIYQATMSRGGLEMNSPVYTAYHFGPLAGLTLLDHPRARSMATILLEYALLVQAHLYLPGGGLGAPQARDYAGGAADPASSGLRRMLWLLTGDAPPPSELTVHQVGLLVADWQLPPILRSIFLDKGDGYEFWAYSDAPVGGTRFPDAVYPFAEGGRDVSPWQAAVLPGAMLGIAHGHRFQSIHASMGAYARAPDGSFPILYQYQPYVAGDSTETGGSMPSGGGDTDPDDFVRELYDHERLMVGRTLVALWDPTLADKDPDVVVRTHRDTRAHVPNYEAHGGEMQIGDSWYVGRLGEVYIAYRPLGAVDRAELRGGGSYHYVRLAGRSGGIVELATTEQFSTLEEYRTDLAGRELSFDTDPFEVSFEALDPESGDHIPMRLSYRPERRWIGGDELSAAEALDHGLLASPWVSWNGAAKTLQLSRDCYEGRRYDVAGVTVTAVAPPPQCAGLDTTVFSPIPYLGDAANYEARGAGRWIVVEEDGDARFHVDRFAWSDPDDLGAYALVKDRAWGDFDLSFDVKTALDPDEVRNLDFAVVFGWRDSNNYYFVLGNETPEYTAWSVVEDGVRRDLAVANRALVVDRQWHRVEVSRRDAELIFRFDGEEILRARDATFSEGAVGLGTLNDSVFFDNLEVTPPPGPSPDPADGADAGCGCQAGREALLGPSLALLAALALCRRRRSARPPPKRLRRCMDPRESGARVVS